MASALQPTAPEHAPKSAAAEIPAVLPWTGAASERAETIEKGGAYSADRYTVDGGGGFSSGAGFSIEGTIGQPDTDPLQPSTGGIYAVTGGFWPGMVGTTPNDTIFRNGFE